MSGAWPISRGCTARCAADLRRLRGDSPRLRDHRDLGDARAAGIGAAVYVQPNWPIERSVEEVRWVQGVHERYGWPHAIIGSAAMFDAGARAVFERQRDISPLCAARGCSCIGHTDERFRFAFAPDRMNDRVSARTSRCSRTSAGCSSSRSFPGQDGRSPQRSSSGSPTRPSCWSNAACSRAPTRPCRAVARRTEPCWQSIERRREAVRQAPSWHRVDEAADPAGHRHDAGAVRVAARACSAATSRSRASGPISRRCWIPGCGVFADLDPSARRDVLAPPHGACTHSDPPAAAAADPAGIGS